LFQCHESLSLIIYIVDSNIALSPTPLGSSKLLFQELGGRVK
jgi:hypothetical protein